MGKKVVRLDESDIERIVKKIIKEDSTEGGIKLYCSKFENGVETLKTEIPERVIEIDGYTVADRLLEGLMFDVYFDSHGNILNVEISNQRSREWFESNFNSERFYNLVRERAKDIIDEGDEVDVPPFIQERYFRNGINVAYVVNENDGGQALPNQPTNGIKIQTTNIRDILGF